MELAKYIEESINLKKNLLSDSDLIKKISQIIEILSTSFLDGKKLLIAGNGGSAADAQHFAAEITGRYKLERKGYPALALTTDSSFLTAWSNDYSFDGIFTRQLESFGEKDDVFFGISTSGNSENIIKAVQKAKEMGLFTISLLGKNGGKLKDLSDLSIIIPSNNTPRIQESHIMFIHIICEELEKLLAKK